MCKTRTSWCCLSSVSRCTNCIYYVSLWEKIVVTSVVHMFLKCAWISSHDHMLTLNLKIFNLPLSHFSLSHGASSNYHHHWHHTMTHQNETTTTTTSTRCQNIPLSKLALFFFILLLMYTYSRYTTTHSSHEDEGPQ